MSIFNRKRIVVSAPRGFCKTKFWGFYYILYKVLLEGPKEVVIVGASQEMVERNIMSALKDELETNQDIIKDFGNQETKSWSKQELILANGSRILCLGAGARIRGIHPDIVILDDLETDKFAGSEVVQNDLIAWFTKGILGTLGTYGQLVLLGTIIHPKSFLARIMGQDPEIQKDYRGWFIKNYTSYNTLGESVWKEYYPTAFVKNLEQTLPTSVFQSEYMGNPVADEYRLFKPIYIKYYKELPSDLQYTITVDPALGVGKEHDYTGIVVMGVAKDGMCYIVDAQRCKLLPNDLIDKLMVLCDHYKPIALGIEEASLAKVLNRYLQEAFVKRRKWVRIIPLKQDNSSLGKSKHQRIWGLEPLFKNDRILINKNCVDLEVELLNYPGRYDDLLDALAYQLDIVKLVSAAMPKKGIVSPAVQGTAWEYILRNRKVINHRRRLAHRMWHKDVQVP